MIRSDRHQWNSKETRDWNWIRVCESVALRRLKEGGCGEDEWEIKPEIVSGVSEDKQRQLLIQQLLLVTLLYSTERPLLSVCVEGGARRKERRPSLCRPVNLLTLCRDTETRLIKTWGHKGSCLWDFIFFGIKSSCSDIPLCLWGVSPTLRVIISPQRFAGE